MVPLAEIRGQSRAVAMLRRALDKGRVAHAYLFCGPPRCGKTTTGIALAAALNCEQAPGHGCGTCGACERIAAGIHPDVQLLERQGAAQIIPIETIRRRLIPQLAMSPHEAHARVFLIEEATALQGPAANALLKTLEEPPPRTHFVLATTAPDQLLPTIRSRCQRVPFAALPPDVQAEIEGDAEAAADVAKRVDALRCAARGDPGADLYAAAADAARERTEVPPLLQSLARRLHEEARGAVLGAEPDLGQAAALARQAALVLETGTAVALHNAHPGLALESLLHRLRAIPTEAQR